jgi:hypothetical protein
MAAVIENHLHKDHDHGKTEILGLDICLEPDKPPVRYAESCKVHSFDHSLTYLLLVPRCAVMSLKK